MRKEFREILKPLILDDSVIFVAIYRIDGTPIFIDMKKRGVLNILYWLEDQVKILLHHIENGLFSNAEFRIAQYQLILHPLSKSLVLCVLANENASLYKLRIDISSVRKMFSRYV